MTAKEKAISLVNIFDESLNHIRCGSNGLEDHLRERAIASALICCDEVIQSHYIDYDESHIEQLFGQTRIYKEWVEVKKEIEKLKK